MQGHTQKTFLGGCVASPIAVSPEVTNTDMCPQTLTHPQVNTCAHTDMHTHGDTNTHTHTHTGAHTQYTQTHTDAGMHRHMCNHTHVHTQRLTDTHTHTPRDTCLHIHSHTDTSLTRKLLFILQSPDQMAPSSRKPSCTLDKALDPQPSIKTSIWD